MVVIVLSGSRAAWLMLLVGLVGYAVCLHLGSPARPLRGAVLFRAGVIALLTLVAASQFPPVSWRAKEALGVWSGNVEAIDIATKRRLSIWAPAIESFREQWINGVGPRGFRDAFLLTARPDNFWMKRDPPGVTHPHLMLLEVATETGSLGLAGLVVFFVLVLRSMGADAAGGSRDARLSAGLCILVAMFPLNAHMAFYGSYWSTIYLWLTAVFVAHLQPVVGRAGKPELERSPALPSS
jgi:O-antigen ligase